MSDEIETPLQAILTQHQRFAEMAAERLASALRMAGLPALPSLEPQNHPATGMVGGGHVNLGGANAHVVSQIAAYIEEAAVRHGRQLQGNALDPRYALVMADGTAEHSRNALARVHVLGMEPAHD